MKKGFGEAIKHMNADVICLQETKAQPDQVEEALKDIEGYILYTNSAEKKGYSSTAILSKHEPLEVFNDIGIPEHDNEGRVITAEFEKFYVITAYVPNSGRGLKRLEYRMSWDKDLLSFIQELEKKKPVIFCGDLNVAHQQIDIKNAKSNYNKSAGYTQKEIDGFETFLDHGMTDMFRHFYPEEIKYTYWNQMFSSRAKNVGWRIDYFLCSNSLVPGIKDCQILTDVMGSDHCPILLDIG